MSAFFDTYIYVAYIGQGLVKIGHSRKVNVRMRQLAKYYSSEIILIGVFLGFKQNEKAFHFYNRDYAVASEVYLFDSKPVADLLPHLVPYGNDGEWKWQEKPIIPWAG